VSTGSGTETTPVREAHRFDESKLAEWMAAHIDGFHGPLTVEQFRGGQSNPTYKMTTHAGTFVLRRKPPGQLVKGAHAVEREVTVLRALEAAGFPVPHVRGLCTDNDVIGTWFYIMDMVDGRIFWDTTFPEVSYHDRPAYFDAMNAIIARLHTIDYAAIGLGDFGRPGNYIERQIARWTKQYLEDQDAGRDSNMDRLIEWLPANIPEADETSLTHGDFRCDNMIFHPTEPRILTVLDWELSTLGNPLADFSYHAMMYRMPADIVAGLAGEDIAALNIPSEADYIAAYCRRTRRAPIPPSEYDFYVAFNFFRLAAIFHGIKGRVVRGTASSAQAQERVQVLPKLTELAWSQAMRARSAQGL
jgi:aminoglycoside phosphotransferase (APT) family kinase protein